MFELDVQLRNGRVTVSHFMPVLRQLRWLETDTGRFRWATRRTVDPGVREVAELVPGECDILLDLKAHSIHRQLELCVALASELPERRRYVACSAALEALDLLRTKGFRTWRTVEHRSDLHRLFKSEAISDEGVSVKHTLLDAASIDRLHGIVARVVAWTVNDPERAAALCELGVDGVTTDNVEVLRRLALPDDL